MPGSKTHLLLGRSSRWQRSQRRLCHPEKEKKKKQQQQNNQSNDSIRVASFSSLHDWSSQELTNLWPADQRWETRLYIRASNAIARVCRNSRRVCESYSAPIGERKKNRQNNRVIAEPSLTFSHRQQGSPSSARIIPTLKTFDKQLTYNVSSSTVSFGAGALPRRIEGHQNKGTEPSPPPRLRSSNGMAHSNWTRSVSAGDWGLHMLHILPCHITMYYSMYMCSRPSARTCCWSIIATCIAMS